jgi:hypothetical protein
MEAPDDVPKDFFDEMMKLVPDGAECLKTYPWNGKRAFEFTLSKPSEKYPGAGIVIFSCPMKIHGLT